MSDEDVSRELAQQQAAAADDDDHSEGWEDAAEEELQPGEEEEGEEEPRQGEEEEEEDGEGEQPQEAEEEQPATDAAGAAAPSARCAMCGLGSEAASSLGDLLLFDSTSGKKPGAVHVHLGCAAWAPRVYGAEEAEPGGGQHGLVMVPEEVWRARFLRCKQCGQTGAAMGCEVRSCKGTFHLPCAMMQDGTKFDCERWQLFCPNHATKCLGLETEDFKQRRRMLRRLLRNGQPLLPLANAGSTPASIKTASRRPTASPAGPATTAAAATAGTAAGLGSGGAAQKKGAVSPSGMGGSSRAPPAVRHAPEPPLGSKRLRTGEAAGGPAGPVTSEPRQPQPLVGVSRKPTAASGAGRSGAGSAPQAVGAAPVGGLLPAGGQQQQQQGEPDQLPVDVRALLQEVLGPVLPGTISAAEAYLYAEGVRSFSDLRFVDHADFWTHVQPCTRLLFNKLFVLVQERDPAAAVAAAAAAAAAAAGAAAAAPQPEA